MEIDLTPAAAWVVRGAENDLRLMDADGRPVLPASSLKGVFRSTAERILRSMDPGRGSALTPLADATFGLPEGQRDTLGSLPRGEIADSYLNEWLAVTGHDPLTARAVYPRLSPASQLFGATLHAGLVTLDDARLPSGAYVDRPHVGIDRFTGGVAAGATFSERLNKAATLSTTLTIVNFAHWQLALLALVFQEINRGYSAVGAGGHKGHGRMTIRVRRMEFQYPEAVYGGQKAGIVSAQGWIASQTAVPRDAPGAVTAETAAVLLPDLVKRTDRNGWRDDGLVTLVVEGDATVRELFREAVAKGWTPWLEHVRAEVA